MKKTLLATLHIPRQEQQEVAEPQRALRALGLQRLQWELMVMEAEQEAAVWEEG